MESVEREGRARKTEGRRTGGMARARRKEAWRGNNERSIRKAGRKEWMEGESYRRGRSLK